MDTLSGGIDYAAVLADLEANRDGLDAAIAGVKQMLGQASASTNTPQHAVCYQFLNAIVQDLISFMGQSAARRSIVPCA